MSQRSPRSARLDLIPLEARTVPTTTVAPTIAATTDARPLVFELRGNVTNDQTTTTGGTTTTNHYDGVVTAVGTLNYTTDTAGTSGTVTATGAGSGLVTVGTASGATYTNTFAGGFTVTDDNGTWATDTPFTGTVTQSGPDDARSGKFDLGPFLGTGQFDVSNYTFTASWDNSAGKGSFSGSVSQPTASKTDLAFAGGTGEELEDGTYRARFTVKATGALMTAPSQGEAAATITAVWEGDPAKAGDAPPTEAAGIYVPVAWNAGTVTVDVTQLAKPEWAKRLVVKIDTEGAVAEANESNNTLVITPTPRPVPTAPPTDNTSTPPPQTPTPTVIGFALSGDGRGHIRWRMSDGSVVGSVAPFGLAYSGPVNLGAGDMNNDGVLDAVAAAGPGAGPRVVVIDGKTGATITSFYAYDPSFTGGVNVAVNDVTGDGRADIVTGAGEGGGPQVNVFGADGRYAFGFFAYDPSFRNGVRVAAGDLDGNGVAEIVTGTYPGGGPAVVIYSGVSGVYLDSFLAGPADSRGGVEISLTTDSKGKASIVSKVGPDPKPVLTTPASAALGIALLGPFAARPSGLLATDGLLPS